MTGGTHLVLGALSGATLAATGLFESEPLAIAAAMLGALLPDIDHPYSRLGRKMRPVSDLVALVFGHRGITHSLFAVLAMLLLLLQAPQWFGYAGALAVGYLSHLAADACTPSGVPLLWPRRRIFRVPGVSIQTGSISEMVVAGIGAMAAFFVIVR